MEEQNKQDETTTEQSTNDTTNNVDIENNESTSDNSKESDLSNNEKSEESTFEPPVNTEALEKQKEEYKNLETQINELSESISDEIDFRSTRKRIVALKEQVLSLFLIPIVEKDNLTNRLQEIFEKLSEKQNELKEEINKVFDDNLKEIEPKIEQVLNEVNELEIFKEARKKLTEIQNELKKIKLRQSDKDNFFSKIQESFDKINQKELSEREEYEMECSNNYLVLKPKIEQITKAVENSDKFNESRKKLIQLQNEIKETKLKKNNRDELFQIIRETFNNLNERQDKSRESFNKESEENYTKILPVVDQAIEFASNPSNFTTARQTLINVQKDLKSLVLSKSQRDELFGKIREVFNSLNEQQDENREEFEKEANSNFVRVEIKVNEALMNVEYSNDFRDIREGLLTVQDEVKIIKLKRNQRNELLAKIREGFEKFDKKRNEYNENKKEEKKNKLNSILDNLQLKITRLKESIDIDNSSINDLKSKIESSADEDKIELDKSIQELESKLKEKNESLKSTDDRVKDIQSELENM